MKLNGSPYYFSTIRKLTVAFGSIFNNVTIERVNEGGEIVKTIKVPLSYGPRQRWYAAAQMRDSNGFVYKNVVPRITFELKDINYDSRRQLQTLNRTQATTPTDRNSLLTQMSPVPYDFGFVVNIITKNMDDLLQIIEQVLPLFTPDYNITIVDIPSMNISRDVPVIYGGITYDNPYESSGFDDDLKFVTAEIRFVCKGYLYRPIQNAAMIKHVLTNVRSPEGENIKDVTAPVVAKYTADVVPEDALPDEDYTIIEKWEEFNPDGTPV